ncbi:acetyltransferase [Echinimonas agarilytica]|uniref:Acetyltransferase n=1 Tax=Echinimonas agarilytica TaxID=1215918 RepID=A0AA41W4V3_9GAMM|nr:acetyltransferase [Echinimonas agarilytica]MCM2678915.1 acetyltransferase [Echinimonas agarilytica]
MRLVILGAGGHGKVVLDVAQQIGRYSEYIFLDDFHPVGSLVANTEVVGTLDSFKQFESNSEFFIAMGRCQSREIWYQKLDVAGLPLATLVHPSAVISPSVTLERGVLVCAGVVVNPHAQIGLCTILNTACSVDHDCVIGDFSIICPGVSLAGAVSIGPRCWIGIGSTIIQQVNVASDCVLGAGAVLLHSTESHQTLVGVPAKAIQQGNVNA